MYAAKNGTISTLTMVHPTGVPHKMDTKIPVTAPMTDTTAETQTHPRKLLHNCIAVNVGSTINAEISKAPTRFMASTIIVSIISIRII